MKATLALDLRQQLARYIGGEMNLREFDEWFVLATVSPDGRAGAAAEELIGEIYLRLAEYSNRHWTEEELKSLLSALLSDHKLDLDQLEASQNRRETTTRP